MPELDPLLACPRCGTELARWQCRSCRVEYPVLGGVPWLFADPSGAVVEWRHRWQLARQRLDGEAAAAQRALAQGPRPQTRRRLEVVAGAYHAQAEALGTLLAPLTGTATTPQDSLLAIRTRLPPSQDVFSYEANVFRDWCWGDAETRAALTSARDALGPHVPQRILVLGAGAGRLAYDLHQATAATHTVAVDLNPLLAYAAHHLARGEPVTLVEFPLAPVSADRAAISRTLRAPCPARSGLDMVLADARRPPFRAGAFDLVVTPWLLDVMDAPLEAMLAIVNRLLSPGGLWLYQGSIAFQHADPARRCAPEELMEAARECGFEVQSRADDTVPYMDSPDSRHGRREVVTTLAARKVSSVACSGRQDSVPAWIVEPGQPIPALPAFRLQAESTRIHAYIMSLIDGKRSLQDLARILEQHRLMPRADAVPALRAFLIRMWEEAEQAPRL
ncbi:MAG: class I SAM-dependent methyltransferase [Pseudomonadales bacterium]